MAPPIQVGPGAVGRPMLAASHSTASQLALSYSLRYLGDMLWGVCVGGGVCVRNGVVLFH